MLSKGRICREMATGFFGHFRKVALGLEWGLVVKMQTIC